MRKNYKLSFALLCLVFVLPSFTLGQHQLQPADQPFFNAAQFNALQWRNIGPYRGGRTNAVVGVSGKPLIYLMGTVGGGIWKTEDAGISWNNISDGFFNAASVGALAVSPSDPNIIYAGMGEHAVRGVKVAHGDGVYKSTDGGKTWQHLGLLQSRHIASIEIHPENPDIVYVAVQGALFGESRERGVFKSIDGGKTWYHVLFINSTTGCADLAIDKHNPRILYAGMWDHQRTPWSIRSGGEGSGLYKSTDGGENWVKLIHGLPKSMGKVGIDVSPADPEIVYANIEAEEGGVFRSEDGGLHWTRTNADRITRGRAWYYTEIIADPVQPLTVYVLNAPLLKSVDGGKTFTEISNPHSDQHALWINPDNPNNMILGNDGGACITFTGGKSWSSQYNQPTAQIYRVIADNRFPYYVYGGQQDNTTIAIPNQTAGSGIDGTDWYPVAGGESAFIAFDPDKPEKIYGGSYQGNISVYDHKTRQVKSIMAYPEVGLGKNAEDQAYRFNWNAPIVANPHEPSIIYHAGNVVFKTTDGGINWTQISPDLTKNDKTKQGAGGFPFTNEAAGAEIYNTISYLACSPHEKQTLWVGTDDGLVQLTRNEGSSWQDVTPAGLGEAMINSIEVSKHDPASAYIVATAYKFNKLSPMVFHTNDYGKTWNSIVNGFATEDFVRVVREDPVKAGLLYAGTESGLYISFNNGTNWHRFQLNFPVCAVTDLTIQQNDLIAATSGRSFWILDDLSPIQQSMGYPDEDDVVLFRPTDTYRLDAEVSEEVPGGLGQNPPNGVIIDYFLPEDMDSCQITLQVIDNNGLVIRSFQNDKKEHTKSEDIQSRLNPSISCRAGFNRTNWDLRRNPLPSIEGIFVTGDYRGGLVAPGDYTLRLLTPKDTAETMVSVHPDPRLSDIPGQSYLEQATLLTEIETHIRDIHTSVNQMRDIKDQIQSLLRFLEKTDGYDKLLHIGKGAIARIDNWEKALIQPLQKADQDVINYPNMLHTEFISLKEWVDSHDPQITSGAEKRLVDIKNEWYEHKSGMQDILSREVANFNRVFKEYDIPALILPAANAF